VKKKKGRGGTEDNERSIKVLNTNCHHSTEGGEDEIKKVSTGIGDVGRRGQHQLQQLSPLNLISRQSGTL